VSGILKLSIFYSVNKLVSLESDSSKRYIDYRFGRVILAVLKLSMVYSINRGVATLESGSSKRGTRLLFRQGYLSRSEAKYFVYFIPSIEE